MPKSNFTLVYKKEIIPKVYFITFKSDQDSTYKPGQFFSLEIIEKTHRPYSTVHVSKTSPDYYDEGLPTLENGEYVSFMISTKPGGLASEYFDNIKLGTSLRAIGPAGAFCLRENNRPKVFISTGTGLAPFVPMIEKTLDADNKAEVIVYFGVWKKSDNFARNYFKKYLTRQYPNFKMYTVIDGFEEADLDELNFGGRVTTIIPEQIQDFTKYDFYICGHPAMCAAMEEVLLAKGAKENIYMEKFGK